MPAYLVTLSKEIPAKNLHDGKDAFVVFAANAADAKAIAASYVQGDVNAQLSSLATVTEIAAGADMEGWRLRVFIQDAPTPVDVTVTGAAAETVDDLGDAMVIALNADSQIANAAYATPNLTIAGVADALGDKTVTVEMLPPVTYADPQPIPTFIGTITDGGIAAAALAVALVPANVIANVTAAVTG